ncbi:hypothetical protein RJG79_11625 [Mycoplasmatota bacterium WC44]
MKKSTSDILEIINERKLKTKFNAHDKSTPSSKKNVRTVKVFKHIRKK